MALGCIAHGAASKIKDTRGANGDDLGHDVGSGRGCTLVDSGDDDALIDAVVVPFEASWSPTWSSSSCKRTNFSPPLSWSDDQVGPVGPVGGGAYGDEEGNSYVDVGRSRINHMCILKNSATRFRFSRRANPAARCTRIPSSAPVPRPRKTMRARERRVNRYYDPSTDQFLSVDPDVAETGQPYAFTGDDPLNATDPDGLMVNQGPGRPIAGNSTTTAVQSDQMGVANSVLYQTPSSPIKLTASSSPSQWSEAILVTMGLSPSTDNVYAINGWEESEHSTDWGADDPNLNNPLDTGQPGTGATPPPGGCGNNNGYCIWAFKTPREGLLATFETLELPAYLPVLESDFSPSDSNPGYALYESLETPAFQRGWTPFDAVPEYDTYTSESSSGEPWSGNLP